MKLRVLHKGAWSIVAPAGADGSCECVDSLDEFASNKKTQKMVLGLFALWERIDYRGPRALGTDLYHCVDAKEGVYEFIKGDLRLLCFEARGALVVCSHVMRKASQKTPKSEVARVVRIRDEFLKADAGKSVQLIDEE